MAGCSQNAHPESELALSSDRSRNFGLAGAVPRAAQPGWCAACYWTTRTNTDVKVPSQDGDPRSQDGMPGAPPPSPRSRARASAADPEEKAEPVQNTSDN